MTFKRQRFFYEHKKEIIAYAVLACITILLCIPFTLQYAVNVFGWAIYGYLVVAYLFAITYSLGKKLKFKKSTAILLIFSVICIIATLHIACFERENADSFTNYIVGAYIQNTVGGVVFAIITSPFVVWCTYPVAIAIFMIATVVVSFFFIRPFVFEGKGNPLVGKEDMKKKTLSDCKEIIIDEAPFMAKKPIEKKPIPYMVDTEKEEAEEARRMLFGKIEDEEWEEEKNVFDDDSYQIRRYSLINKPSPKVYEDKKSNDDASELLFGKSKEKQQQQFVADLNYGDEEIIFDSEEENFDILKDQPMGTLAQALIQRVTDSYAPAPIGFDENQVKDPARPPQKDVNNVYSSLIADDYDNEEDYDKDGSVEDNFAEENFNEERKRNDEVNAQNLFTSQRNTDEKNFETRKKVEADDFDETEIAEFIEDVKPKNVMRVSSLPIINKNERVAPVARPVQRPKQETVEESYPTYHKIVQRVEKPKLPYNKPPISMLQIHATPNFNPQVDNWDELKEIFEVKLRNLGIEAELIDATKGPTITLCAIRLDDKCPIAKLFARQRDLQRWLKSSKPIAILQQIPGTDYCGVQIPNEIKGVVGFKEIISSREYREAKGDIVIALGKTAEGEVLIDDLAAMPHALVAGETGSGKSVCLNVILASILFRYSPDEVKLLLIDLKEVEMALYADLPHMLLREPLSDPDQIVNALKWIRQEVIDRFTLFKQLHFRNLSEYNKQEGAEKLPRIVIIIDEASELMENANVRKVLESTLSSLARISRAAGVHLIFATQNPVKTVITNEIQNNLNTKIAFAVGDYNHSQVIFKAKGAECLLGRGDMYIKRGQEMTRAQCAYVDTPEIEAAVNYIKENNEYSFDDEAIAKILKGNANEADNKQQSGTYVNNNGGSPEDEEDNANCPDLNWQALKICVDTNYVSCSYLQRKLKRGYNTIANVLEELAAEGYISSVPQGSKEKREILISKEDFEAEWQARFGSATVDEDAEYENFGRD